LCCAAQKKTGSSTVGLNNFDDMLHPVSEYVELCQLEGPVAVTFSCGATIRSTVFMFAIRETFIGCTSFMYVTMLVTVNWRCHHRNLFTHL
jgi:hypothetical protein